jgi:hypothetical protein
LRTGHEAFFAGGAETDERAHLRAELHGLVGGEVVEMAGDHCALGGLADHQRVDDPDRAAFRQPAQFLKEFALEVR